MFSVSPDFYMFTVLTSPPLHGMSSFLAGGPPTHSEATREKKLISALPVASYIQLAFAVLHVDTPVRVGGGRREAAVSFYPELSGVHCVLSL